MALSNKKVVIKRNQIYLGKLFARCQDEKSSEPTYVYCRHILLRINEASLAQDLVYSTYQNCYAIEGIESPTVNVDKRLVVKETFSLSTILFILGYKDSLEQKDISTLFRMLLEKQDIIRNNKNKFMGIMDSEVLYNKLIDYINGALFKPDTTHERFDGKPKKIV